MIANPYLYCYSSKDMERIITGSSGQFTSRERDIMDAIKIKFSIINIVFYICWIPNLLNGILLWTLWFHLPATWIISLWYIMVRKCSPFAWKHFFQKIYSKFCGLQALINPLQALFNSLVYRRWSQGSERLLLPWKKMHKSISVQELPSSDESEPSSSSQENFPLLQNVPRIGINGYSSYR